MRGAYEDGLRLRNEHKSEDSEEVTQQFSGYILYSIQQQRHSMHVF